MSREEAFDLYTFVGKLVENSWIEEVCIFGSRRHLANVSFGSDIDLLITPNQEVSLQSLLKAVHEPYVDAFLVVGGIATSVANQSQISIGSVSEREKLDAVTIWTRPGGWQTKEDYRVLRYFPDKTPGMSDFTAGAEPILMICALSSEFQAVVKCLPKGIMKTHWGMPPYYRTYVRTNTGRERLVVAVQAGVASVNAAISVTRILGYFEHPELAILVGITAGIKKSGASLGDILVPTATVDVETGKITPKGKEPAGLTLATSPNHQRAVASWLGATAWQDRWETDLARKPTKPKINADCTLACTSSVIGYDKLAKSFLKRHRKIRGIEMEAVGVAAACLERTPLLVIKSISDWADKRKNDKWHAYCEKIAADLAVSLIQDGTI